MFLKEGKIKVQSEMEERMGALEERGKQRQSRS